MTGLLDRIHPMIRLRSKLPKRYQRNPKFLVDPKEPVELAWTDNKGIDYYQFCDPLNAGCLRALHAATYYRELEMCTTREMLNKESDFIKQQVRTILDALTGGKGNINLISVVDAVREIEKVTIFRDERVGKLFEPDIAYKFASVVFFDQTENPYRYDYDYGQKKIARWKENEDIGAFFLRQPVARLMPFTLQSEVNFPDYFQVVKKIMTAQSEGLSGRKSRKPSTSAVAET